MPETTKLPPNKSAHNRIDLDRAIKLRLKGCTYQEIADTFGCNKVSVWERLKKVLPEDTIDIDLYKKHRADIFASDQLRYRNFLTDEKLAKAPAQTLGWLSAVSYDKERLERGLATENISIRTTVTEIRDTIAKAEERLKGLSE